LGDEGRAEAASLRERLARRIARTGPLPLDAFMHACLADPTAGYWSKHDSIGAAGDFVTAPEISQVFGELIGVWAASVWQTLPARRGVRLVELGPGRGTLMRDLLRAAQALPQFLAALSVHLVELSAPLCKAQRATLAAAPVEVHWHADLADVPPGPAIVIANEFLDALPIRQLQFAAGAWRERVVALAASGELEFALGGVVEYDGDEEHRPGAIVELRAGEEVLFDSLAARGPGQVALFIDYGPAGSGSGDTLQAVHRHAYVDPLSAPGNADLTAHVRFAVLANKARAAGLVPAGPLAQAEFLGRLGIQERASRLMAANPAHAGALEWGVGRLLAPTGMGELFKAMTVSSADLPPPPPFG
jgi:SAM-dependent MidA family methyltransferase